MGLLKFLAEGSEILKDKKSLVENAQRHAQLEVGQTYTNKNGSDYKVLSGSGDTWIMRQPKSGWTFTAHVITMYDDGQIEWDYSTDGTFDKVDEGKLADRVRKNDLDYDDEVDALYAKDDDKDIMVQFQDRENDTYFISGKDGKPSGEKHPRVSSQTWGRVWNKGDVKHFNGPKYVVRKDVAKYLDKIENESLNESQMPDYYRLLADILIVFEVNGYDPDINGNIKFAEQVADMLMHNPRFGKVDPKILASEWFNDTKQNYPEDLEELVKIGNIDEDEDESLNESEDREVLWKKGNTEIIKDGYGFGIDNGVTVNRFIIDNDGNAKFDSVPSKTVKEVIKRLIKQGEFNNPHYKGDDAKFVGNTLKYHQGIKESDEALSWQEISKIHDDIQQKLNPDSALTPRERREFIPLLTAELQKPPFNYSHEEANDIAIKRADNLDKGWRNRHDSVESQVKQELRFTSPKNESYDLLSGTHVEQYRDYNKAKARAKELGLKEAEYGDAYGVSYCFWNKSGDRNEDEEVIAYYKFRNGKPVPLSDDEAERIARRIYSNFDDLDESLSYSEKDALKSSVMKWLLDSDKAQAMHDVYFADEEGNDEEEIISTLASDYISDKKIRKAKDKTYRTFEKDSKFGLRDKDTNKLVKSSDDSKTAWEDSLEEIDDATLNDVKEAIRKAINEFGYYNFNESLKKVSKENLKEDYDFSGFMKEIRKELPEKDIDHHATDLYVRVSPKSTEIIKKYGIDKGALLSTFVDNIDHDKWYELPFVYNESCKPKKRKKKLAEAKAYGTPFKAYITNLGKYNEGELVGKWVPFPVSKEYFDDVLKEIGINDEYEEWFVTDYDSEIDGLSKMLGEYTSFDELNRIAEKLNEYGTEELSNVMEVASDIDDAMEGIDEGRYQYYPGIFSDADLGQYWIDEVGFEGISNPENYFDYESFGRDVRLEYSPQDEDDPETAGELYCGDEDASDEDIGYECVQGLGGIEGLGKDTIENYFDVEKLGRDISFDGYTYTSDGCVYSG